MQGEFGKKNFILRKTTKFLEKFARFQEISIAVFGKMWYTYDKEQFFTTEKKLMIDELPQGSEMILVVDDHETIWDFLIEALQMLGYSVLLAENGLDAVTIYEENPGMVDLVLLDMIMPKAGGHETFLKLKAIDPDVKVLLSSGFVNEKAVEDLLTQGACGFLPKPHRLPVVAKAIRDVLDGKGPVLPGVCNG